MINKYSIIYLLINRFDETNPMVQDYTVILKSLNFLSISDCEQRTALHTCVFTGHEKHYRFLLDSKHFELVWRKGIENTYLQLEEKHPELDSKETINYLKIFHYGELVDYGLMNDELEAFCLQLEKLVFNERKRIDIPFAIRKLLQIPAKVG